MKIKGDPRFKTHVDTMADLVERQIRELSGVDDPRFKRFWEYEPFPVTYDWWRNTKRTNVIIGANKAGKTTLSIFKAICIYTGMVPPGVRDLWKVDMPLYRSRHVRIICQDYTKHWPETIRPLLLSQDTGMLPEAWAKDYDPNEHIFYGPDGSYLSIMAIDPKVSADPNVLRGPKIDHTYIDEKQQRMVYTESLTRSAPLKDGPRSVDLGFCPQDGFDWTYDDFYLTAYDRYSNQRLPDKKTHPSINVLRISMRDNPSISRQTIDEYIASLRPWEISYRVDGNYAQEAGNPYFPLEIIYKWQQSGRCQKGDYYRCIQTETDIEIGTFLGSLHKIEGERVNTGAENIWQVWEPPKDGEYYMMLIDTAEGNPRSDYQVCDIWRCSYNGTISTARPAQVAQLRRRIVKPSDFIIQCCCMANVYGDCLLVYEVNNTSGGTVRDRSRNYCNLYTRTSGAMEVERQTDMLGWHTDHMSKPSALEEALRMIQEWGGSGDGFCGVNSPATIQEMMTYEEKIEKNPNTGVTKRVFMAAKGHHDDTISCFFMMAYILRLQSHMLSAAVISDTHSETNGEKPWFSTHATKPKPPIVRGLKKVPSLNSLRKNRGIKKH